MAERLKYGFNFFYRIIALYLGIKLSRSQRLCRVGLAETAGKALIRLLPPVRVCLTPLQLCWQENTPNILDFCGNIYFGRAGNAGFEIHGRGRAHAWEIPPVQHHHLSLAGEGKSNISIKVSSDICAPSQN